MQRCSCIFFFEIDNFSFFVREKILASFFLIFLPKYFMSSSRKTRTNSYKIPHSLSLSILFQKFISFDSIVKILNSEYDQSWIIFFLQVDIGQLEKASGYFFQYDYCNHFHKRSRLFPLDLNHNDRTVIVTSDGLWYS